MAIRTPEDAIRELEAMFGVSPFRRAPELTPQQKKQQEKYQEKQAAKNAALQAIPARKLSQQQKSLEKEIGEQYRRSEIERFYDTFIHPLMKSNKRAFELLEEFDYLQNKTLRTKENLAGVMATVFLTEELFLMLLETLPPAVRDVLMVLLYDRYHAWVHELQRDIPNANIDARGHLGESLNRGGLKPIYPEYMMFLCGKEDSLWENAKHQYIFMLYLPPMVRTVLRQYFTPPPEYSILPLDTQPTAGFHYTAEASILENAVLLGSLVEDDNAIEYDANGRKILKSSLKKVQNVCSIQEFFPDTTKSMKELEFLATTLVVKVARGDVGSAVIPNADADLAVEHIRSWLQYLRGITKSAVESRFSALNTILFHVKKQYTSYDTYSEVPIGNDLFNILKMLPSDGKWVGTENLVRAALLKDDDLMPVSDKDAASFLYCSPIKGGPNRWLMYDKNFIADRDMARAMLLEPLVKGGMFLFAALGLVEIVYDLPKNTYHFFQQEYLSVFDGLKGVRLTALGEYLLERTESYTPAQASKQASAKAGSIILDEHRLLATLTASNPLLEIAMQDYMRLVSSLSSETGSKIFTMDYTSFLKDCKDAYDVEGKIKTFKKRVKADVPAIWQKFFDEVVNKVEPLDEVFDYRIFTLKPSPELMRLLMQDEVFKKIVVKAEGYKILVLNKDVSTLRKRLEKHGYVLSAEVRRGGNVQRY
jgi:hypothetical protein